MCGEGCFAQGHGLEFLVMALQTYWHSTSLQPSWLSMKKAFIQEAACLSDFEIRTGPVGDGWCDFTVRLGDASWSCSASYIDHHPLHYLIHSAVDLYDHLFVESVPVQNAVWDSLAADEPGGIVVRATPAGENVKVSIFYYPGEPLLPSPEKLPEIQPVAEGLVGYWTYADAIFNDAAKAVVRHGFTGLRNAWEANRWDIDAHYQVLPIEHFLYLANLVMNRSPKCGMTFQEEISLLNVLSQNHAS